MAFVDTDRDQVIRVFLTDELVHALNAVRSDISQLRRGSHRSGLRTQLRNHLLSARTVYALWDKVGGSAMDPQHEDAYRDTASAAYQYLAGS